MSDLFERNEPNFRALHKVSEHVYTFATEFLFAGKHPIHNRSVIVHAPAVRAGERGALAIINPAELDQEMEASLRGLASALSADVTHLISPGDWHYLFIEQHVKAFPSARAYVPPGRIPSKKPAFDFALIDIAADNPFPELAPHLLALTVEGLLDFTDPESKLARHELVFLLPEARAITSGDVLYYNGGEELSAGQKAVGQRLGIVDFHFMKWRMVKDPKALARSLERVLAWDFDRYISIHGKPGNMLERGAKTHVKDVLAWANAPPSEFAPGFASG